MIGGVVKGMISTFRLGVHLALLKGETDQVLVGGNPNETGSIRSRDKTKQSVSLSLA